MKRRALISVYFKEGVEGLAAALSRAGYELVSSGGTEAHLRSCGIPVTPVEAVSGNPEAFGGRMKTLSFQIESAILFDRDDPAQKSQAEALGLVPIDLVACNFYPFEKALAENLPSERAVELIDIGGPAMVRAAAKNFRHVLVLVDPSDYQTVAKKALSGEEFLQEDRLRLACKAFEVSAAYEARIDRYFELQSGNEIRWFRFHRGAKLRYGENPHQEGWAFKAEVEDPLSLFSFAKIAGKELSFNNFLDASGAVNTLSLLGGERPACVIVKHANPCGAAYGGTIGEAFEKAWEGDPLAAFGGIVALNRPLTLPLAERFVGEKRFAEIFLSPEVEPAALGLLASKKKNLILLTNPHLASPGLFPEAEIRKIRGGVLIQDSDPFVPEKKDLECVSKRFPAEDEWRDLLFAWKMARESKSNAVALARGEQLVGSGVGQQDRVRACRLAVEKAGDRAQGACAASDAFFPFPDGPELLLRAGVRAIVHPGGSLRDDETLKVCDAAGAALVTTRGRRAFRH